MTMGLRTNLIRILLAGTIVMALAACEGMAPRRPADIEAARQQAAALAEQGQVSEAAALYKELADTSRSPERERFLLLAADVTLTPETFALAREYLSEIEERKLDETDLARKREATARLSLLEHRPNEALQLLPTELAKLPPELQHQIQRTRADALFAAGFALEGLKLHLELDPQLTTAQARDLNQQALWEKLMQSPSHDLYDWSVQTSERVLKGWLDLAYIVKTTPPNMAALDAQLAQWLQAYPQHPATPEVIPDIRAQWREFEIYPEQIAVLLPLSGRYNAVAGAVLHGLLAAYYGEGDPANRPRLQVYDIGERAEDAWTYYNQAVDEGATFVIGPLDKNAVNALVASGELRVPTLSLNYADEEINPPAQLFQFGLFPEDESRQVAERASLEGHEYAIALAPQGEWGERLVASFKERFEALGGTVLADERYASRNADYSAAIKRALNINQSQLRHRQVTNVIKLASKFEARRRADVDLIFIAGAPRQARSLRPQLEFHHAFDLPVYSTSHIYSGMEDPRADRDLHGVIYCDIPWVLGADEGIAQQRQELQRLLPASSRQFPRLVALGLDAYRVIPYLKRLSTRHYERFEGLTGNLAVDDNRRIHRELKWATFVEGRPQVLTVGEAIADEATPNEP